MILSNLWAHSEVFRVGLGSFTTTNKSFQKETFLGAYGPPKGWEGLPQQKNKTPHDRKLTWVFCFRWWASFPQRATPRHRTPPPGRMGGPLLPSFHMTITRSLNYWYSFFDLWPLKGLILIWFTCRMMGSGGGDMFYHNPPTSASFYKTYAPKPLFWLNYF